MTEQSSERQLVEAFAGPRGSYYDRVFSRIRNHVGLTFSFNFAAALLGPVWAASRRVSLVFWFALLVEIFAVALVAGGLSGDLGGDQRARAERLLKQADQRSAEAQKAKDEGRTDAESMAKSADALRRAAEKARQTADAAGKKGPMLIGTGLLVLLLGRALAGLMANPMLERRFARWRSDRSLPAGLDYRLGTAALVFGLAAYGLTAMRIGPAAPVWLQSLPVNRDWQTYVAGHLDTALENMSTSGDAVFTAITSMINSVLGAAAYALTMSPWPVTMAAIVLLAWQLAGIRVAIFTVASLAYLAFLGFWEKSLDTVALLGTSALLCLLIGIPLGIWCGRSPRVYATLRPVLDFMQTMPAFVYLIPVIALFGIGKPPGVIATLIFGTPPAVRLTALGIQGVSPSVREAAEAFGATRWFLLTRVDLPLAMPSIMAGVNQTILMCLSMVVIAALIGAKGLGDDVLNALQYAAVGQGLLAGLAILICAMIIDRIVQAPRGK